VSMRHAPDLWRELHTAADELGLSHHFNGPARGILDDHLMLNRAGIPAVVLIDFEYPYRHTTGDTVERCAPESLAAVGTVLLRLLGKPAGRPVSGAASGREEAAC